MRKEKPFTTFKTPQRTSGPLWTDHPDQPCILQPTHNPCLTPNKLLTSSLTPIDETSTNMTSIKVQRRVKSTVQQISAIASDIPGVIPVAGEMPRAGLEPRLSSPNRQEATESFRPQSARETRLFTESPENSDDSSKNEKPRKNNEWTTVPK